MMQFIQTNPPFRPRTDGCVGGGELRLSRQVVSRDLRKVFLSLLEQRRQITLEGRGKSG